MVGEGAIRLAVDGKHLTTQLAHQPNGQRSAGAVSGVDSYLVGARELDSVHDAIEIRIDDITRQAAALASGKGPTGDQALNLLQFFTSQCLHADLQLESVELGRIMTGGHLGSAVYPKVVDGE